MQQLNNKLNSIKIPDNLITDHEILKDLTTIIIDKSINRAITFNNKYLIAFSDSENGSWCPYFYIYDISENEIINIATNLNIMTFMIYHEPKSHKDKLIIYDSSAIDTSISIANQNIKRGMFYIFDIDDLIIYKDITNTKKYIILCIYSSFANFRYEKLTFNLVFSFI